MPGRLDLSPFGDELSVFVDDKGAALDTKNFFAVHVFLFDDIEEATEFFIRIAQEIELKPATLDEFPVGLQAVSRNPVNPCLEFFELRQELVELLSFQRASGRIVFRVKVQNHFFPTSFLETESFARGRLDLKIGNHFAHRCCFCRHHPLAFFLKAYRPGGICS